MEPRVTVEVSRVAWNLDVNAAKDRMVSELFEDLRGNLARYMEDPLDDEAVHDIRVDIRKLISVLYFFKPLIEEEKERELRKSLKEVLKSFGSIREGDMLVKSVREFMEKEGKYKAPAEAVISEVEKGREEDVAQSLEQMGSADLQEKVSSLETELLREDLISSAPEDQDKATGSEDLKMETYAINRFRNMLGKLRKLAREDDFRDIADVHAYRIRCKKASYSLMLAETVTALDGMEWIRRLKEIQDVTGNIHDAQVNRELLEDMDVEDRGFQEAYMAFLDRIIRKRMEEFREQLEAVKKSGTRLKRKG
ncbi:MAG TPA: CHAD domain-containing protein [Clostridiaceae bacterium]|nr:CHAD domain-containing protein [Clostridiaceae bacterium]